MERKINIEEVRHFLAASDKQFTQGGILIDRVRIKRDGDGNATEILIDYEQRETETETDNK